MQNLSFFVIENILALNVKKLRRGGGSLETMKKTGKKVMNLTIKYSFLQARTGNLWDPLKFLTGFKNSETHQKASFGAYSMVQRPNFF